MESINKEVDRLLDKGQPLEWFLVIVRQNSKLEVVDPIQYAKYKGLKYKLAVVEKINNQISFL